MRRIQAVFVVITVVAVSGFAQSGAYGNGNGAIIDAKVIAGTQLVFRRHIQTLQIGDAAKEENRYVYKLPAEYGNPVGKLYSGDTIHITQLAETAVAGVYYYWLNISADRNLTGWIFGGEYGQSAQSWFPYFDNRYEILERISAGGKQWTARKLHFMVTVWENLNIRDKPGIVGTKVIAIIVPSENDSQVNLEGTEMTEETDTIDGKTDIWLKITYRGVTGWVFGGYTSVERGGYSYYTPEAIIASRLGYDY